MRTFKKVNDPLLKRAESLDNSWFPVDGVGISLVERRVLFYVGIFLIGLIVSAPTLLLGLDPIQAVKDARGIFGTPCVAAVTVAVLIAIPLAHEAFHLAAHPDLGKGDSTIVGGNILMLFILFDGPMTRLRMMVYSLSPFVGRLISLCSALFFVPALWPVWVLFLANHIAMCTGDLLLFWKILRVRVPFKEVWNCGDVLMAR